MLLLQRIQLLMHSINAARITGPASHCSSSGFTEPLQLLRIQRVVASAADPTVIAGSKEQHNLRSKELEKVNASWRARTMRS